MNQDNDSDLAVANISSDNISILINNGDGTFQSAVNYEVSDGPQSVSAADLDCDNDFDLAVANANSDNVSILMNNGNGTFQMAASYEVGSVPCSIIAHDLDNDIDNDLAVTNWSSNNVSVLMNLCSMGGCDYVIGDFNGNGAFNVADIVDGYSRLKTGLPEPAYECECPYGSGNEWAVAMDVNNSCAFNVADIVDGYSKLKTGSPELEPCEDCPPPGWEPWGDESAEPRRMMLLK